LNTFIRFLRSAYPDKDQYDIFDNGLLISKKTTAGGKTQASLLDLYGHSRQLAQLSREGNGPPELFTVQATAPLSKRFNFLHSTG
jgi:hypothetical protein